MGVPSVNGDRAILVSRSAIENGVVMQENHSLTTQTTYIGPALRPFVATTLTLQYIEVACVNLQIRIHRVDAVGELADCKT